MKERAMQFNDFFFLHKSMQVSEFMMELDLNFISYILFGEANITADARFPAQAKRTIYIGGEKPYYVAPVL